MNKKIPVSVVVLTFNEERNIGECLSSLKPWAGEIFVLDSFSTDRTKEIAGAFADSVVDHEFEHHAAQKNWALDNLPFKYDWVFFFDADERATPGLQRETAARLGEQGFDGYYLPRMNCFMGTWIKHGGWYPDWQLRLFRRGAGRYEDRAVHEHVLLDGKAGFFKNAMLHYDFKGFERYFERHNAYSTREAEEVLSILKPKGAEGKIEPSLFKKGPHRRRKLKELAYRHIPVSARPFIKFLYMYIFRLGFLDGKAGFHYCLLHTFYEYQISLKVMEALRHGDDHEAVDPEHEISRPHSSGRMYKFLIDYKFRSIFSSLGFSPAGMTVLDICCGSGMVSQYYAEKGAQVTGCDISEDAIGRARERSKRFGFAADFRTADSTKLPFPDKSFDIVSVHDGLHHIPDPALAVAEMCRIAKKAVVIVEPARSFITRISVALGVSTDYEGKDYVHRFDENELRDLFEENGITAVETKRYLMFYPHKPGAAFGIMSLPFILPFAKLAFSLSNLLLGWSGNKIQAIGKK